ncbi:MAG: twitch domain-containing radical SAM protein, partial [Bdellovibrionaceae bacterium]|nr:twitch domain-containing radical SAM protein [Pseudobdellovibrionaceae bacterium]
MAGKHDKDSLLKSPYFCMMPWVHMHFIPNSTAHLCCISDVKKPIGKFEGKFEQVYNSTEMKKIRLDMLGGKPIEACQRCYELEKNDIYSLRQNSLNKFQKYFEEVQNTNDDGGINSFRMRYLDIRFNNGCNFRCQTCGPTFSSAWYADQKRLYPLWQGQPMTMVAHSEKLWSELEPSLKFVEEAYFAGGEPLITEEVYKIMDYWIEHGHFDLDIGFTTNFSNLTYKSKNIIDYW